VLSYLQRAAQPGRANWQQGANRDYLMDQIFPVDDSKCPSIVQVKVGRLFELKKPSRRSVPN
jgi:hypothetical protein